MIGYQPYSSISICFIGAGCCPSLIQTAKAPPPPQKQWLEDDPFLRGPDLFEAMLPLFFDYGFYC